MIQVYYDMYCPNGTIHWKVVGNFWNENDQRFTNSVKYCPWNMEGETFLVAHANYMYLNMIVKLNLCTK